MEREQAVKMRAQAAAAQKPMGGGGGRDGERRAARPLSHHQAREVSIGRIEDTRRAGFGTRMIGFIYIHVHCQPGTTNI